MPAYLVGTVQRGKCIGVGSLAQCEGVGDLEERVQAEGLGEVGAQATEHVVVEEDIALDLFCQALDSARVVEAQLCAPGLEGVVCIGHGPCHGVVAQEGQRMARGAGGGSHGRHGGVEEVWKRGRGRCECRTSGLEDAGLWASRQTTSQRKSRMDQAVSRRRLEGRQLTSIKSNPPVPGRGFKGARFE